MRLGVFLTRRAALAAVVLPALLLCFAVQSEGAWTVKKEKPFIAKIGETVILLEDFEKAVRRLHTSKRVGKALSEEKSFEKHNFEKYLDELIEAELMEIECERLGVDQDADFLRIMHNYKLNRYLDELRREEITERVKVSDRDVQAELDKEAAARGEAVKKKTDKEPAKVGPHDPASQRRQMITRNLMKAKSKVREEQFFEELKAGARIRISKKNLKKFSSTDKKLHTRVMAHVGGEKITAFDLLRELRGRSQHDAELLKRTLDALILHKLLDKEAFGRSYGKVPHVRVAIAKYRKNRLSEFFKRKVILPLIKVEEKEVLQYYKSNPKEFIGADSFLLRMIFVAKEKEAIFITSELKRGADFGYLAKEHSLDATKDNQGALGWVPVTRLSEDIARAAAKGKVGGVLGPFTMEYGFSIMELLEKKSGELKAFEDVKKDIDRTLGRKKFVATYNKYLVRLRETVRVEINEQALRKVIIVRPKEESGP